MGGGIPGVALEIFVSDALGLVETLGTGGGRGVGDARGVLAVDVDGVGPERVEAIFIIFENRFPFFVFASVSLEGAGKGSVDGAAGRDRSFRGGYMLCGGGVEVGMTIRGGGLLGGETFSVAGTCGGLGALYSETLASGVGGRDDRGTAGRARWRGPDGGKGGGIILSCCVGSSVWATFCGIGSAGRNLCLVSALSSSSCGSRSVGVSKPTSSYVLYP